MTTLLHLDSSARTAGSTTRTLTREYVDAYLVAHSGAELRYRDLDAEPLPFVSGTWIDAAFSPPDTHDHTLRFALSRSDALVDELLAADHLVIGAPVYNFTVPAALKAWIDQVSRAGRTFAYGDSGPHGLLRGKSAVVVSSSGTDPPCSPAQGGTTRRPTSPRCSASWASPTSRWSGHGEPCRRTSRAPRQRHGSGSATSRAAAVRLRPDRATEAWRLRHEWHGPSAIRVLQRWALPAHDAPLGADDRLMSSGRQIGAVLQPSETRTPSHAHGRRAARPSARRAGRLSRTCRRHLCLLSAVRERRAAAPESSSPWRPGGLGERSQQGAVDDGQDEPCHPLQVVRRRVRRATAPQDVGQQGLDPAAVLGDQRADARVTSGFHIAVVEAEQRR